MKAFIDWILVLAGSVFGLFLLIMFAVCFFGGGLMLAYKVLTAL